MHEFVALFLFSQVVNIKGRLQIECERKRNISPVSSWEKARPERTTCRTVSKNLVDLPNVSLQSHLQDDETNQGWHALDPPNFLGGRFGTIRTRHDDTRQEIGCHMTRPIVIILWNTQTPYQPRGKKTIVQALIGRHDGRFGKHFLGHGPAKHFGPLGFPSKHFEP